MQSRSFQISLLEVALFVQYQIALQQARRINPRNPEKVADPNWRQYDSGPFLNAILTDIFDNACEDYPSEYQVKAKAILENSGFDSRSAHLLCEQVMDQVIAAIGDHMPNLAFHDKDQRVGFWMQDWDVIVTEFFH